MPVECHLNDSTNNLKLNLTNINLVQMHNESYLCHSLSMTNMTLYLNDVKQNIQCDSSKLEANSPHCFYKSWVFWLFVTLTYLGTIGFNVGNCISDAICFDVLGEDQQMKYGRQRVFGTIGFGVTALIAGYAVDFYTDPLSKNHDFTPAIIVMLAFASMDLFSIKKLKLPKLSSSDSIYKDVVSLFKNKRIALFLVFATIAGILDSFVIYYMFWHLEEVAEKTGFSHNIKIIEGWVIAAECLGGEIIFFLLSGKIIRKLGYVHCLSFCFLGYAIRLGLISIIPNPWYLVPIELVMQGWTYALCYTCIVGKYFTHLFYLIISIIYKFPSVCFNHCFTWNFSNNSRLSCRNGRWIRIFNWLLNRRTTLSTTWWTNKFSYFLSSCTHHMYITHIIKASSYP